MPDERRREGRIPTELRIRLAYGSIDELIERYALNVSRGGIFVRTLDPKPAGTEVDLDIALESGDEVIRGKGVVAWTTAPSAPGEPPRDPGMGIRFTTLDPESRALVDRIVGTRGAAAESEEPPRPEEEEEELALEDLDFNLGDFEDPDAPTLPAGASATAVEPGEGPSPSRRSAAALPNLPGPAWVRPPASPPEAAAATGAARPPAAASPAAGRSPIPGPARPTAKRSDRIVGIDLGTTNSCAAVAQGGRAQVIASKHGHLTLPSIVAYDAQGRLLVGHAAKAQMIVNPRNTVYGAKRLVGRPFASPTVQACRDRFHYEIVKGLGGAAAVRFAGRTFSMQQISALVLKEIREMATQALGEEIGRAVITVPAYYNDHQRNAVREAGGLAGLDVERIVNEPTSAALAFGFGKGLDKRILVYDLGGGTFDASVLEIQGDVYEVVSTGGDTFLGGVDFDGQLVDHLVWAFREEQGFLPPDDRVVWQRIRDTAEETKVALSSRERAVAHVPYLCKTPSGQDVDLKVEVTRAELEMLTERLVDRTLEVCQEVLSAKGLQPADIDEVLLVGGQSRMPLVWRKIGEAFGRQPNKGVHPDEAVALGAALLADSLNRIDSVVLIDVLAMGIGVGLPGGRLAPVLPRNTRLPSKKSYELATTRDGQTELELQVFQGDSPKVSECEYLGTVSVPDLPARPRGAVKVSVEFSLGTEGILGVTARNLATGQTTGVQFATLDTPESLRQKLGVPEPQVAPAGARPMETSAAAAPGEHLFERAAERRSLFGRLFGGRK
jgi:molecular chaperone DnaK